MILTDLLTNSCRVQWTKFWTDIVSLAKAASRRFYGTRLAVSLGISHSKMSLVRSPVGGHMMYLSQVSETVTAMARCWPWHCKRLTKLNTWVNIKSSQRKHGPDVALRANWEGTIILFCLWYSPPLEAPKRPQTEGWKTLSATNSSQNCGESAIHTPNPSLFSSLILFF